MSTNYDTVGYERSADTGAYVWRLDRHLPTGELDRFMCTGLADTSPRHDMARGYKAACSACWLNIPHTAALHAARAPEVAL
jgi:hypothetical protein